MPIPRDPAPGGTRAFLREGYDYVGNRCRALGSDLFRARIMLHPVTVMAGEEAARRFYDGESFTRVGAMPQSTLRLLQDVGSVRSLDGEAVNRVGELFNRRWRNVAPRRRRDGRVILHDRAADLLCDAACAWAGAPVAGRALRRRAAETTAMIDGAGTEGPRAWRGLLLRRRTERWARRVIAGARAAPPTAMPASRIAHHRDARGEPLDLRTAGVELINLVRPTVAVASFITFTALALHEHAEAANWLREDPDARASAFVDEVRRYYPFFPVVGGRARRAFTWRDHPFRPGDWVLLGLHATDHDPRLWPEPGRFRPERFAERPPGAFDLIPQGADDHARDHRCPGEWITVDLMRRAVRALLALEYEVPVQDLRVRTDRFPTLPADGMVIKIR